MPTRRPRRAPLTVRPLEDRTVPSGGSVVAAEVFGNLVLVGDANGNDVTVTETAPNTFQVTGNGTTQITDPSGQVLAGGFTTTGFGVKASPLVPAGNIFGLFQDGDDALKIVGTGQTFVQKLYVTMGYGSDLFQTSGVVADDVVVGQRKIPVPLDDQGQPDLLATALGLIKPPKGTTEDDKDTGDDFVVINNSITRKITANTGGGEDFVNLTNFLAGNPYAPSPKDGVTINSVGGPGVHLGSFGIFGSLGVYDSQNPVALTIDGAGSNGITNEVSADVDILGNSTFSSNVIVTGLAVGGNMRVAANGVISLTNVDVGGGLFLLGGTSSPSFTLSGCSAGALTYVNAGGNGSLTATDTDVAGDTSLRGGAGGDTVSLTNLTTATLEWDGGDGTNSFGMTGGSAAGKVSLRGGAGNDAVTLDGVALASLIYDGGDGDNSFNLQGHGTISGSARLLGGSGADRLVVNQTVLGTHKKGKVSGGNLDIQPGGGGSDQVLLGYGVSSASDANVILGTLTISAPQASVEFGETWVYGPTVVSLTGKGLANSLNVDSSIFYGKFTYANGGGQDYITFGQYSVGTPTVFYGGLDLHKVKASANPIINLAPATQFAGPVYIYVEFDCKGLSINAGPGFYYYPKKF